MRKICFVTASGLLLLLPALAQSQQDFAQQDTTQQDTMQQDTMLQDTTQQDTTQQDTTQQDTTGMDGASQKPATIEVGIIIGEPSGLSAKYWLTKLNAFDAGIAWSFTDEGSLDIFTDFVFHPYYIPVDQGNLPIYFGLGAALRIRNDDSFFGIRIPVGVEFLWERAPLAVFAQVAPIMEIIPDIDFRVEGGAGIRFAFGRGGI